MSKQPSRSSRGKAVAASARIGDVASLLRSSAAGNSCDRIGNLAEIQSATEIKRQVLADFCRLVGARLQTSGDAGNGVGDRAGRANETRTVPPIVKRDLSSSADARPSLPHLSPRMRQTLRLLLAGDGEKQIALKLGLSQHTIHVYVKALYRGFGVNSRAELMSHFVAARGSIDALDLADQGEANDDPHSLRRATG